MSEYSNTESQHRSRTLLGRALPLLKSDCGDVPGWVLITMMTAGLVVAIWAIAAPALGTVFDQALTRVISFKDF